MARSPNDPIDSLLDVLTPAEKAQIPWINMPPGYGPQGGIPTQGSYQVAELNQPPSGDPTGPGMIRHPPITMTPTPQESGVIGPGGGGRGLFPAPAIRNPNAPMFDYSRSVMTQRPNVPQTPLQRYDPPRGVPEEALRAADPKNIKRLNLIAQQGAEIGGLEWYNMQQLHERFKYELGDKEGTARFIRYLDLLGATSPRTRVPENVRNASYYYRALLTGEATPQRELRQTPAYDPQYMYGFQGTPRRADWIIKEGTQAEYPYGMMPIHVQNVENILKGGLPLLQNPKPPSFTQNLAGNWRPVTIDVHNMRLLGLGGREAPTTEYGFLERMQQQQAARLGMDPAQYQASLWIGGAKETGVKSGTDPMLKHFERRVEHTAEQRGQTKEQVLKDFIHGRAPLLMIPDIIPQAIKYFRGEMNAQ
jgi:hypothetical protein